MQIGGASYLKSTNDLVLVDNPSTGMPTHFIPAADADDVGLAVETARRAFEVWKDASPLDRQSALRSFIAAVRSNADELALLETIDVGKTRASAEAGLQENCRIAESYLSIAEQLDQDHSSLPVLDAAVSVWDPLGVIVHIIPWNAPLNASIRRVAISLISGNACVIKPSSLAPVATLRLCQIATEEAGILPGLINVVTGPGPQTGAMLLAHPDVAKASFIGSTSVGLEIMGMAAGRLLPATAELGGKSPQIVYADAPVEAAAGAVLRGFTANAGQICTCGTRLIVDRQLGSRFVAGLVSRAQKLRIGDAADPETEVGPLISEAHRERVDGYVRRARALGRTILTGGAQLAVPGYFYPPTIVADVQVDDEIFQEEVFGPVLAVTEFDTTEQAIQLANSTRYGLAAGVWTQDLARATRTVREVDAGTVWVNAYWDSPPDLPRSARRQSGYGPMEFGLEGIRDYQSVKQVTMRSPAISG
jgi:aldehyde dehydrogenase (NAD+)